MKKDILYLTREKKNSFQVFVSNLFCIVVLVFGCYLNYKFIGNSTLVCLAIIVTWFASLYAAGSIFKTADKEEAIKFINNFFDKPKE